MNYAVREYVLWCTTLCARLITCNEEYNKFQIKSTELQTLPMLASAAQLLACGIYTS